MTPKDTKLLEIINEHPDGIGWNELARKAGYDTSHGGCSNIQPNVKRLEEKGFIKFDIYKTGKGRGKRYILPIVN